MSYLERTIRLRNPIVGLAVGRNVLEGEMVFVSCMQEHLIKSIIPQEDDFVTKAAHKTHITCMSCNTCYTLQ